jgi:hypothetical protein
MRERVRRGREVAGAHLKKVTGHGKERGDDGGNDGVDLCATVGENTEEVGDLGRDDGGAGTQVVVVAGTGLEELGGEFGCSSVLGSLGCAGVVFLGQNDKNEEGDCKEDYTDASGRAMDGHARSLAGMR